MNLEIHAVRKMVPTAGLEPAQVAPLAPQTSASTNFATSARIVNGLTAYSSGPRGQLVVASQPTRHGLTANFQRGSQSEPQKLAARTAVKRKLNLAKTKRADITCTKLLRRLARCRCRRRRCGRSGCRRGGRWCRSPRCGCGRRSRGAQQRSLQHTGRFAWRAGAHVRQQ